MAWQSEEGFLGFIAEYDEWWCGWPELLWFPTSLLRCRTSKLRRFFVFIRAFMCRQMVSFDGVAEQMPGAAVVAETMWPAFWSADAPRDACRSSGLSRAQRCDWGPRQIKRSPRLEGYNHNPSCLPVKVKSRGSFPVWSDLKHSSGSQLQLQNYFWVITFHLFSIFKFKKKSFDGLSFIWIVFFLFFFGWQTLCLSLS